jgi:hypothetical protein
MSTSSISGLAGSSSISSSLLQSVDSELKQGFQQLAQSLQSGNLADAQKAYASLENLLGSSSSTSSTASTTSSSSSSTDTLMKDFAAIGQALQSGDISSAQKDFQQLQSDAASAQQTTKTSGHHHGHHHHVASSTSSTSSTSNATSTSSTSSTDGIDVYA